MTFKNWALQSTNILKSFSLILFLIRHLQGALNVISSVGKQPLVFRVASMTVSLGVFICLRWWISEDTFSSPSLRQLMEMFSVKTFLICVLYKLASSGILLLYIALIKKNNNSFVEINKIQLESKTGKQVNGSTAKLSLAFNCDSLEAYWRINNTVNIELIFECGYKLQKNA